MSCSICEIFKEKVWEIGNNAEDKFPENFKLLKVFHTITENDDIIYQCPACDLFYIYRKTLHESTMETNFIERINSISDSEKDEIIEENIEADGSEEQSAKCPKCKSTNVEEIDSRIVGNDFFVTYKCFECGFEEKLNESKIDSWF